MKGKLKVSRCLLSPLQGGLQSRHLIESLLDLYQPELAEIVLHATWETAATNLDSV